MKMETLIPTSVSSCWDFLRVDAWDETMPKMDPFYEGVSLHGDYHHLGVNMILVRKRTKRLLAFGKRDFVFLSVTEDDHPLEDGTWVSGTVSVESPDAPRHHGYTRAFQDSIAFYQPRKLENGEEQCYLTIVCRIDLNDSSSEARVDSCQCGSMSRQLALLEFGLCLACGMSLSK